MAWDVLSALVAIAVGGYVTSGGWESPWPGEQIDIASRATLGILALSVVFLAAARAYDGDHATTRHQLAGLLRIPIAGALTAWVAILIGALTGTALDVGQLIVFSLMMPACALVGRGVLDAVGSRQADRVLVIGTGAVARRVVAVARRHPNLKLDIAGFVDDAPMALPPDAPPVLGSIDDLSTLLEDEWVDRVIVAFTPSRDQEVLSVLRECDRYGVPVDVVPRLFELLGEDPQAHSIGGLAMVGVRGQRRSVWQRGVKRAIDATVAGLGIIIASPALAVIAIAIKLDDGGPILFRQQRVGRDGRLFDVLKFRTMSTLKESNGAGGIAVKADDEAAAIEGADAVEQFVEEVKREGEARTTRVGRILRKASLDELPQLWNVLWGEMSLVGPRPLRPFEVASLDAWQLSRQQMRPGITGLWQVLGRSEVPWGERMQLDYTYVRHWSNLGDLKIILRTIPAVLARKGAV